MDLVETMGIDSAFEIVQAFCKAFCWTYEFKSKPFALYTETVYQPVYEFYVPGRLDGQD